MAKASLICFFWRQFPLSSSRRLFPSFALCRQWQLYVLSFNNLYSYFFWVYFLLNFVLPAGWWWRPFLAFIHLWRYDWRFNTFVRGLDYMVFTQFGTWAWFFLLFLVGYKSLKRRKTARNVKKKERGSTAAAQAFCSDNSDAPRTAESSAAVGTCKCSKLIYLCGAYLCINFFYVYNT